MLPARVKQAWLRNRRRLADMRGVMERRRFRPMREEFYEKLWVEAAAQVGGELAKCADGLVRISRGGMATFLSHQDVMLDSAITIRMMLNKALTYELIAAKGLRTPRSLHYDLATLDIAENFLRARGGDPVVVKPAEGTGGGIGVTTGITSMAGLHAASRHAAGFGPVLLIEEQLAGSSFRLLFLDGEFIDAVRRDPPVLTGDGRSTILQLATRENRERRAARPMTALLPLVIDGESRNTLAAQGKTTASVPEKGEAVRVKLAVNENGSAQNHVVREVVHEEIIEVSGRLVRDFGIGFAGLDITARDISAPLAESDTIFNEINVNPGIHHHYFVANPEKQAGVARLVLEHMFTTGRGVLRL